VAVEVRTGDGVALHARSEVGVHRPAPGDEVGVGIDPDKLLIYGEDDG
jgi:hypothetical protein